MSNIAITVENLSKRYNIGALQYRHDTLRDALMAKFKRSDVPESEHSNGSSDDTIWALKDISFEVKHGEILGIIGRNGAGKSTLLKILSRITEPTSGRAIINGRVGSLLEVGTGFHPELTGRENIYLNGAILGMRRTEIDRKFDEIVAFSEIEKFLDTPVKRYSSGMYVRLAFAVAAHLEPEILLIDEVLAVGDIAFQKKCLGKMGDVAQEGRTVLFVSHNMATIANICSLGLLIQDGQLKSLGIPQEIIGNYVKSISNIDNIELINNQSRTGNQRIKFSKIKCLDTDNNEINEIMCGQDVFFEMSYLSTPKIGANDSIVSSISFYNLTGQRLFNCRSDMQGIYYKNLNYRGKIYCHFPQFPLPPGEFRVNLQFAVNGVISDWVRDAFILNVIEGDFFNLGYIPQRRSSEIMVQHEWFPPEVAK